MKKVILTKAPSLIQIKSMAYNLRYKYNEAVSIDIAYWHYTSGTMKFNYMLYMEHYTSSKAFDTWEELQQAYIVEMDEQL